MNATQKLSLYLAVLNVFSALTIFGSTTALVLRFGLSHWWYAGAVALYALCDQTITYEKK